MQLIQDTSISIYRVRVINLDSNVLEATRYFKAAAADKKIDIKLKSPGPKDIIIEALDDKSKIMYTANIAFEQGGGYSYVKWPDVFSEFKNQKSKNYSLIFKLTDDSSTSFLEVDDDYSSVRHLFDKYQCTTCHTKITR